MDKRQHHRQLANLEALLKNDQDFKSAGCIKDYSSGGVLLELTAPLSPAQQSTLATARELQLLFFAAQGPQAMPVVIAHQSSQFLGLRFTRATRSQLACLATAAQELAQSTAPAPAQGSAAAPISAALANAIVTLKKFMDDHLSHFFELTDNALLTVAEQQKTQVEQQRLFDAMLQLRTRQYSICQQVLHTLSHALDQPAALAIISAQPGSTSKKPGLSLVGKEAFEDWLLVRVAISRAELLWREDLIALQVRLDDTCALRHGMHCPNPFAPSAICHALHAALTPLQLPHSALRIIYECLQAHLLSRLHPLYQQLNQSLAAAGVLPDLDATQYLADQALQKQRQLANAETPDQPSDSITDSAATPEPPEHQPAPRSQLINRLQQSRREPHNNQSTDQPQVSESSLNSLLDLQQQLSDSPESFDGDHALRDLIQQQLPELSSQSADTIELVEELFASLTAGEHIAPELQAQLRKLQLPVLRLLLSNPELIDQEQHPLRKTINHLALLSDRNSLNAEHNRTAVTQAVQTILGNPEQQAGLQSVDAALERLVQREQRLTVRNLDRLRDSCEGQQRLQQANQAIESILASVLPSTVPQPLLDLLEYGWKALMRLTWLREGADSQAWAMCIKAVSQLGDSVREPPLTQEPLAQQDLLKLLRIGLSKMPDELGRHARLLSDIELLLNEPDAFPQALYQAPIEESELRAARLHALAENDSEQRPWLQRARKLKPGQWFEVTRGPFQHQPAQIIWQSADCTRFLLANRQGTRSLSLDLDEAAQMLRDGSLSSRPEFSQQPVEQGLDALVQKVYARLAMDASQDPLTNLLTRREFIQRLDKVVNACAGGEHEHTLVFINLLQFKLINNTCGYAAGDRLLRELSERIRSALPADALAGRIGADQFALLLPGGPDEGGQALAQTLKQSLEAERFHHGEDRFVINTAVTLLGFRDANHSAMELLRNLETSASLAKQGGRTKVQQVRPGDEQLEALDEVMHWITRINRALDEDQLQLICQRIQPLTGSNGLPHFEILLRVLDEQGQAMPPAAFIEVAETYHRMNAVDRWVIEHVLAWMQTHASLLPRFGGFSINLSGHSLNDESFLEFLFSALSRYPVPRDKLIFEITETTAVANLEEAADFISELRGIGCRFSLDDFGAGQSSYTYLKRLPVDYLKIDGAFIRDITRNPVDYALARSITEMGHHLNKLVIAEYVANNATLQAVTTIGVDYAQGYQFGLPVKLDDLADELRRPSATH
ncbi:DUF1631 family protein [Halopseudomonas salegens]|uniref:Diguanylate cyclase/phosphodiesterase n=1 Tax=Halopseudomonas salegens TaxID=1434072 RepID=A0A1H2GYI3_9GAMM|nr:DUF1631 family protein [Halopseudomonas salegens]SDU24579.1 diguanylate cyclase/phosphodiesterase [Halopseudomonas salegens]